MWTQGLRVGTHRFQSNAAGRGGAGLCWVLSVVCGLAAKLFDLNTHFTDGETEDRS